MRLVSQWFARGTASAAILLLLNRPVSAQTPPPPESSNQQPDSAAPTSPLAIHVGDADLLFGGFIDFSHTVDPNYQAGLTWGRTMQFRLTTHPNDIVTAAASRKPGAVRR